ncbi:hypothetical protein HUJ04_007266 [Dendroctonus ponderosae]|uniref:DUF3668 domain-containing protein n=2 Tax=Dendroctonus ponderosae TaxID=77166 RepID=A0AAR5PJA7_DENPD|nr:hypothetical protein HUJ04_007266 [Dendroctonus ponderosae]
MNQLSGKYVNVVLSVQDGRGMEFVRHPIHVVANYSGRILESDKMSPDDPATFGAELVWEEDKKDLRKVRSANQPLRVECLSTDPQNRQDRIGFALLSLRSAQIIPLKDAQAVVNYKWHKLIGCQTDKKKYHPELYLALSIRDHLLNDTEKPPPMNDPLILEEEQNVANESTECSSAFPLRYLDDGYIHIGDDEDYECFSLNILVRQAKNLDSLLPEALVFRNTNEKFHMTFKIFGVVIKTKPFYQNFHDTFALNEKVVVRMLANQETLFEFLKEQHIEITLFNGHELLGTTEVRLGSISFNEDIGRYFFELPAPNSLVPFGGDEDVSPYLEVTKWLKTSTESRFRLAPQDKAPTKVVRSNLEKPLAIQGFGDQLKACILDKLEKVHVKSKSECSVLNAHSDSLVITKSAETVIKNVALSPRQTKKYDVRGTYVKYVLEVTLQNLVWRTPPKEKIVIFKFLHPRASNYITIFTQLTNQVGEIADLKNIGIKVSYVSTVQQIENILNAWPPKLVLTDEKEKLLSEEYEFDASKFFCDEYRHYRYVADLKAVRTLQPLARMQVILNLENCEIGDFAEDTDFHLTPPIVDELLSVMELADIERWKKTQREIFEKELEVFKQSESERMENMWKEKKNEMEQKLEGQMNKCQALQQELQLKLNNMKTDKYLIRSKTQANIFEDIFNENWQNYRESDPKDIIEVLSKTQRDNEYLRKLVADQREKLQCFEKTTLTKEQTANLLQELKGLERGFEETQKAKKFFKEQWKTACEEIHELKTEEYKKIHLNIRKSKEELSHLSLDSFNHYVEAKFDLNEDNLTNRSIPSGSSYY